jgi:hypothetical protein
MRRLSSAFLIVLVLVLSAGRAEAVTAKDILDLHRAGLGEEVLLALVEVDGGVFTIDTDALKELKAAGVGERVIAAMIRSGRTKQEPPAPARALQPDPPQPQVIVVEHERPVVRNVVVPVPVYIPVTGRVRARGHVKDHGAAAVHVPPGFGSSVPGFGVIQPHPANPPKPPEPVYWGWGGKLRPDAWKPRH